MNRRQFVKLAGLLGVGSSLEFFSGMSAFAADDRYSGPLWIMVNAAGGWDPTSFCDPKGYGGISNRDDASRLNNYDANSIETIGNISYAPPPDSFLASGANFDPTLYSSKEFFEKNYQELLVINGIDTKTNSHANGQLMNWSGSLRKGYPSFAALVAGVLASKRPLSYITNGGYAFPADLVVPVRMDSKGVRALFEIAYPNRSSTPNSLSSRTYFSEEANQLIRQANILRIKRLRDKQFLPKLQLSLDKFLAAGERPGHLQDLANLLAENPERPESDFKGRKNAFRLYQQGRLAIAGYEAGTTASVNINMGGFDTHGNHDAKHYPRLMDLLQGIDAILDEANSRGLRDRIVMVIGSDFGRTNKYNKDNGKDHWPITSMMLLGNSNQVVRGNRVVGATSNLHKVIALDPMSLQANIDDSNVNAITLTPTHIHRSLRALAGIENSLPALRFSLDGQDLPLF